MDFDAFALREIQSVDTTSGGQQRGRDNAKNVDGRKRHIVVDSMGLLLAVLVTAASVDDGAAAAELFGRLQGQPVSKVRRVFADSKYHNYALYEWLQGNADWELVIVRRPEGETAWVDLPLRWTVERTFAWLGKCRRLTKEPRAERAVSGGVHQVGHGPPHAQSPGAKNNGCRVLLPRGGVNPLMGQSLRPCGKAVAAELLKHGGGNGRLNPCASRGHASVSSLPDNLGPMEPTFCFRHSGRWPDGLKGRNGTSGYIAFRLWGVL